MQNRKVYPPEFKLSVVKEYLNGDKSQAQICEEHSISPSIFFRWLKKYKESGYDDSVFNVRREGRSQSFQITRRYRHSSLNQQVFAKMIQQTKTIRYNGPQFKSKATEAYISSFTKR